MGKWFENKESYIHSSTDFRKKKDYALLYIIIIILLIAIAYIYLNKGTN